MQKSLVNKLTWRDIKEIAETLDTIDIYDKELKSEERYYNEAIIKLCTKYKTLAGCKVRYNKILPVAEEIIGRENGKERAPELVILRSMIACKLREEEYSISDIGRVMGYDHATVMHYFKKKEDFFLLPNMYEREVRWFKQFDERLNDDNDGDN